MIDFVRIFFLFFQSFLEKHLCTLHPYLVCSDLFSILLIILHIPKSLCSGLFRLFHFLRENRNFSLEKNSVWSLPSHAAKKRCPPFWYEGWGRAFGCSTTAPLSTSNWTISNNPFWIAKLRGLRCDHIRSGIDQQFYDFKIRFVSIDRVNQGRCIGQSFRIRVCILSEE